MLGGWLCAGTIPAISKPSKEVTFAFYRPGQVAEVAVRPGQTVKKGDLLIRQDDRAEQVQVAQLKAESEDQTRVKAAQAQLDQKKVDLKRTEEANKARAATDLEVEHARLEVTIGELSLDLARFEHSQSQRKYEEARLQVERMRLCASIDGRVEKVTVQEGEAVDNQAKAIRLVCIDPLWIDVPVPVEDVVRLRMGQPAKVNYAAVMGFAPQTGKIIQIRTVTDDGSGTLYVRVEVPNAESYPAGLRVDVEFQTASVADKEVTSRPAVASSQPKGK